MTQQENLKAKAVRKNKRKPQPSSLIENVKKRTKLLRDVVQRTIVCAQRNKTSDVLGGNEVKSCLDSLQRIFSKLGDIDRNATTKNTSALVEDLQRVTNDVSSVFRSYGTDYLEDLLSVCFGSDYATSVHNTSSKQYFDKFELLLKHSHPIGYRILAWKPESNGTTSYIKKNRIVDDYGIAEEAETLECFDLGRVSKNFHTKVYGLKIAFRQPEQRKTLIVSALVDDIMLECIGSEYVTNSLFELSAECQDDDKEMIRRFIQGLTLKDVLVYNKDELINRFVGYKNQVLLIKQKTIAQVTKEFLGNELFQQRTTLLQLLLKSDEHEYQYLAYLLYDLLTSDSNGSVDTHEQTLLFDSLPWNIKRFFREAMKQTINYTNTLASLDSSKIPLEQQICLMKADDSVKEKAMLKLKEVKAKSEDSGSKARQYLEGLLKIPFGIYRDEPILSVMTDCTTRFNDLVARVAKTEVPVTQFPLKEEYTSLEMRKYMNILEDEYLPSVKDGFSKKVEHALTDTKRNQLISNVCNINAIIKSRSLDDHKIRHSGRKVSYMKQAITEFIKAHANEPDLLNEVANACNLPNKISEVIPAINESLNVINSDSVKITEYMSDVRDTLDGAVHGHTKAKRQVERIIGQWINGDKSGYCFGFEGPPGVGKTSLAKKGIANCLKDNENSSRPFAFIAIGGSSNGSTLDGHNYTYVGSTWGRIVDILMETKCMNPIIFIDELDKVSRTEHGREIIGILTHLIDTTQNDTFQDKYFNGIDIDLSKALFIFSYNDVDSIDRILLDRIHRVKFDPLSMEDKLTITRKYLLPEIYDKMGLKGVIDIPDEVITHIVLTYTCEPGVRKLKEILFEVVGEINLSVLQKETDYPLPVAVTVEDIRLRYLKDRHEIRPKEVHAESQVGLISGLWANALGQGGVLPIEVSLFPCATMLELKLTGMQGDVMKESMTVAKTLAWKLACNDEPNVVDKLIKSMDKYKLQGVHIHVPEGATPKDGPSAGTAITCALYSLFTNKKIRSDIAITGEMCLQGRVTAIGGLDLKILGGIRAGVKTFLFPKENDKDFNDFYEKYKENPIIDGIEFLQVETIQEVFIHVFEKQ